MRISKVRRKPPQRATSTKSPLSGRSHPGQDLEVNAILRAQRTIGNQNVLRSLSAQNTGLLTRQSSNLHPGYALAFNRKPLRVNARAIQRDTSANASYRKRVIANKDYTLYLRDITHFHPDARFTTTVRKKWLSILTAYCAGHLKDTKYITISDMKYNQQSDFDSAIKNMLDITWAAGDNPAVLAAKLNNLDDDLNAAKALMLKMTKPSGFLGKRWVRQFHAKRHEDINTFMGAGSWTHVFSWSKWLKFW